MNRAITIAIGGILAAGVAVGAYRTGVIGPQYAEVVRVTPVTVTEPIYADVVDVVPIVQTSEVPQQICSDRQVQVRQPERHGTRDGTIAGALIGGLLGNQIGKGDGRTAATVAGAVGGGFAGREIDRRHEGGRISTESQRVCHTETRETSTTVGYEVQYQLDGRVLSKRMSKKPSDQVWLGERDKVIGYDVEWRYRDKTGTLRMSEKPGDRLPMRDGAIVVHEYGAGANKG
jgi:uncharacterized protein YcfJ